MVVVTMKERGKWGKWKDYKKTWAHGDILYRIALWKEMKLEFANNAKKQSKF